MNEHKAPIACLRGTRLNLTLIKKIAELRGMRTAGLVLTATGLSACVTINIYFPAAAAEKAADKVIDEIWQVPAGQHPPADPPTVPATTPAANQEPKP